MYLKYLKTASSNFDDVNSKINNLYVFNEENPVHIYIYHIRFRIIDHFSPVSFSKGK